MVLGFLSRNIGSLFVLIIAGVAFLGFSRAGGFTAVSQLGAAGGQLAGSVTGLLEGLGRLVSTPFEEIEKDFFGGGGVLDSPPLPGFPDIFPIIKRAEGVGQDAVQDDMVDLTPDPTTPARRARATAEATGQLAVFVPAGATGEQLRDFVNEINEKGGSIGQITFGGLGTPEQLGELGIEQGEKAGAF